MKYFIITIDTEGDNLWQYRKGDPINTENTLFLPRFQDLCNKYGFKPVWLTNYEMVCDQRYVDYIKTKMEAGLCEVGIHVHAWNNPPLYKLDDIYGGNPFLIEYPKDIMRAKFKTTFDIITKSFGKKPISHRAGRWVMNDDYFNLLEEFGVKIDCSHTLHISWEHTPGLTVQSGSNYKDVQENAHFIGKVLEIPMTIRQFRLSMRGTWKHRIKTMLTGEHIWLRPASSSLKEMKNLCNRVSAEPENDYLEFMVHSSELMAGGSPYFKDVESIEMLYGNLNELFAHVSDLGYRGATLEEYYKIKVR